MLTLSDRRRPQQAVQQGIFKGFLCQRPKRDCKASILSSLQKCAGKGFHVARRMLGRVHLMLLLAVA